MVTTPSSRRSALRFTTLLSLCTILSLAGAAEAGGASNGRPDSPHRRSGLWEQRLTLDDGSFAIPVAAMCVDAKAEKRLAIVGAQMDRVQCSAYRMTKRADRSWRFYSVCKLGGLALVTTQGAVSGDLNKAYSVQATGSTSGAPKPSMNGEHRITINAKWVGACPKGQVGGDLTTGGLTTNVFAGASPK